MTLKIIQKFRAKVYCSHPLKLSCRRNLAFHWDCRSVCYWGTWKLHPISPGAADGSVSCFAENGEYLPWNIHKLPEAKFHSGNSEISLYITFRVLTKAEVPPPVRLKSPWSRWWWIGTAGLWGGRLQEPLAIAWPQAITVAASSKWTVSLELTFVTCFPI